MNSRQHAKHILAAYLEGTKFGVFLEDKQERENLLEALRLDMSPASCEQAQEIIDVTVELNRRIALALESAWQDMDRIRQEALRDN